MSDCIFCKLAKHEIPTKVIYEDEWVMAFEDMNPQTDKHVLLIPKLHVDNLFDEATYGEPMKETREALWQAMPKILDALNITEEDGFRVIQNNSTAAGQSVYHLHFHILSGKGLVERLV